jgi:hypothetical protein
MGVKGTLFVMLPVPPAQVKVCAPAPLSATVFPEQTTLLVPVTVRVGMPGSTVTVTVLMEDVQVERMEPCTE